MLVLYANWWNSWPRNDIIPFSRSVNLHFLGLAFFHSKYVFQGWIKRVSEVSRNHSGLIPWQWVRPFSATKFHETYAACWIAVLLAFVSTQSWGNLMKTFIFLWSPRRKIGDLRKSLWCSVTGNSARRSHRTRTAKVRDNRLFVNYSVNL